MRRAKSAPVVLPWARPVRQQANGSFRNPESFEVMDPIKQLCTRMHWRVERCNAGLARAFKNREAVVRLHSEGFWDLMVFIPAEGIVVMVECKMPGETPSASQQDWGEVYRDCGLDTVVAVSAEQFYRDVQTIIARRKRERIKGQEAPQDRAEDSVKAKSDGEGMLQRIKKAPQTGAQL